MLTNAFTHTMSQGLAFLHSHGIAHRCLIHWQYRDFTLSNDGYRRDICSKNIMLSPSGPPFRVYLIDFGLASQFAPQSLPQRVTWTGGQIELPEVPLHSVWDRSPVDASVRYDPFAADIFALYRTCSMNFERVRVFSRSVLFANGTV